LFGEALGWVFFKGACYVLTNNYSGRFRVIWAGDWRHEDDEPGDPSRMLCHSHDILTAVTLLKAWRVLARHMYGDGVLTIVEVVTRGGQIEVRRVHDVVPTCASSELASVG
jgi:hypothetical protein